MAERVSTTNTSANATILMASALNVAEFQMKSARTLAEALSKEMQAIHGGSWRFDIDHEEGFALISRRTEREVQPMRGNAI